MSTIYDWSLRAADNTRADDLIDWSEGQLPSTINNSARGMMQRVREYLSDTGGTLEGVVRVDNEQQTTAITLQTKSPFSEYKNDIVVGFKAKGKNAGATTVSLNHLPAKSVYKATELGAVPLVGGEIQQGCIYSLAYDEVLSGWHLLNPTSIQSPLDLSSAVYPAGFIGTFAMQAIPSGWLLCDGSAYSRSFYSDLFAAIGTTWGSGDGLRTFNVPDLRGMFLRGFDDGRNIDRGRSFASVQQDLIQSHHHEAHKVTVSDIDNEDDDRYWHGVSTTLWGQALDDDQKSRISSLLGMREEDIRSYDTLAVPFGHFNSQDLMASRDSESETRPINVSVVFAIKI
ncbi:phage tail protein [Bartonella raoultii]|uniref:phage tail protein n=1 Tax=Bartonella raoultii TaxID=1457020 RepID=UPI001ABB1FE0|nr:phage tail protein [Bartonella raoultii]